MTYAVLPRAEYLAPPIRIRPVRREDREAIRVWRNGQIKVLRQTAPITEEQQTAYFDRVVLPDLAADRPRQILFSIFEGEGFDEAARIGYGGLVHISWEDRRAEVSFLLATHLAGTPDETGRYLPAFHAAMRQVAFEDLRFVKLTLETWAFRTDFLKVYAACGFREAGRWTSHIWHDGAFHDSLLHECLCEANLP